MATAMTRTEHNVSREDGNVYYYKVGQGEPLVFLHNVELGHFIWEKTIDRFAEHYTCYVVDLPGHDQSDIPPRQYRVEDYTKAILDVLDSIGLQQTSFVGSHGGCVVIVDIAVNHPERVKKIVFDGVPYWNLERGKILWERFWLPKFTDHTSYDVPVYPLGYWTDLVKEDPTRDTVHDENAERISQKSRHWISLTFDAITKYDVEAAGPKVKAPVLLAYGEHDALRRGEQRAIDGIPNAVHKVVPGAGSIHWDTPDEFVRMTMDFLQN
jgi:pimeloyl-ACP methyl ester carboxylesterase